jgi:competence protein ComEC
VAPQLRPATKCPSARSASTHRHGPSRFSTPPSRPAITSETVEPSSSLASAVRDGPLLVTVMAVAMGIWIDHAWPQVVTLWCGLSAIFFLSWWAMQRRGKQRLAAIFLLLAVLAVGGLWHHSRWYLFPADELVRHAKASQGPVQVRAIIRQAPQWRPPQNSDPLDTVDRGESTRIAICAYALRNGAEWQPVSGQATLMVDGQVCEYLPGDRIQFSAILTQIPPPLNPGEPDFAAMRRQARELCNLYCRHPEAIRLLSRGVAWMPRGVLGRIQLAAQAILRQHVGPEFSGLACAMVLGIRAQLDPANVDDFFLSGTVHLLAVSGLHLGILASLFWLALRTGWLPQRCSLVVIIFLVIGYAAVTGCRPPVVRATILILVFTMAKWLGRRAISQNSLGAAALLTLAWNPAGLFDVGTQLSFLAVATIFVWAMHRRAAQDEDPLDRLIRQSRPTASRVVRGAGAAMGRAYAMTAVVWGATTPLVALRFHLVAPVGVVVNPLLWFPVAVALFSGFGVLLSSVVCPPLAAPLGWVCEQSLAALQETVHAAARVPWGHAWVSGPPSWWVLGFYALSAIVWIVQPRGWRAWPRASWFGWLVLACILTAPFHRIWRQHSEARLTLSFVAVGHGTSVLVQLPDGKAMLYDAGRLGTARSASRPISAVLWSRKIGHLDALVLSHADADHFNAVPALLQRFSVGVVYVSPLMFRNSSPAIATLREEIERAGVPIRFLAESARLLAGSGVSIEVLHPPPEGCGAGDNADSIVLSIRYAGRRVLLPGDLESPGLDELLAELPIACDVLMAPHHGSRHSCPERVLRWSAARHIVVSGGPGSDLDQVIEAFSQDGARVLHTQRDGAVILEIDSSSIRRR